MVCVWNHFYGATLIHAYRCEPSFQGGQFILLKTKEAFLHTVLQNDLAYEQVISNSEMVQSLILKELQPPSWPRVDKLQQFKAFHRKNFWCIESKKWNWSTGIKFQMAWSVLPFESAKTTLLTGPLRSRSILEIEFDSSLQDSPAHDVDLPVQVCWYIRRCETVFRKPRLKESSM